MVPKELWFSRMLNEEMQKMRHKFRLSCAIFLLCVLSACATNGNPGGPSPFDSAFLNSHLVKGKTTEADVIAMFGQPASKYTTNGAVAFNYNSNQYNNNNGLNSIMSAVSGLVPVSGASAASSLANQSNQTSTRSVTIWFNQKTQTFQSWDGNTN